MANDSQTGRTRRGLSYRIDGSGNAPAVVLVNSIGLTTILWNHQRPAFERDFRVVCYDQRGHGSSEIFPAPYSIADLGGDLVTLLDELDISRASICGLSLGGLVATWTAANHPGRVDRLILACTSAYPNDDKKWSARISQARAEGMKSIVEGGSKGWFTPRFRDSQPEIGEQLKEAYVSTSVEGYVGCCEALRTANLLPDLAKISAPTLIVAGRQDRGFPVDHAVALHEGIKGSRLVVFEDAAHFASVEKSEEFNRLAIAHLTAAADRRL
jgi:3-oxoadipate enol-lactonase